jgi:hypothetical protein
LILSVSVVLVLGALVVALCRWAGLKAWHAAVSVLLGFYLADSSLAPSISSAAGALFAAVSGH